MCKICKLIITSYIYEYPLKLKYYNLFNIQNIFAHLSKNVKILAVMKT